MNLNFLTKKHNIQVLMGLLATYMIVLAARGFLFSSNDVVDVMAYAKFLNDPSLYPSDFYIQNISGTLPNERIIFSTFLSFFGNSIKWMSLFLHFFFSLSLFLGIYKISALYLRVFILRWLVILVLAGPLYGIGIGDCELYYNMFIASLMAKSIGIWSVYLFLIHKNNWSFSLLIPVTLIHPTVGAQLFLILATVSGFNWLISKKVKGLYGIISYILTAGIWLFLLQYHVYDEALIGKEGLFEIFEFRLAHHFFPDYFTLKGWIIAAILSGIALFYFLKRGKDQIILILLVILAGMIFYSLSMFWFPLEIVLTSQWFKAYIWLELFAVIAIFGLFEQFIPGWDVITKWFKLAFYAYLTGGILLFVLIHIEGNHFSSKNPELFYLDNLSTEADIGIKANNLSSNDALFIVPMHFTEFKYFSERSCYIDYKTLVHRKNPISKWYHRIKLIYGIDILHRMNGSDLYQKGKENYYQISDKKLQYLSSLGISHMIAFKDQVYNYPILAENDSYKIYRLN